MAVTPVSVAGGAYGNALSVDPSVSRDGRYVAFRSAATNLVSGDTNNASDVFLHDRQTGGTTLISVNSAGTGPGNGRSDHPSISADGRFVVFRSAAGDLIAGDANAADDVFLRDWQAGTTVRLSGDAAGGDADDSSSEPFVNVDGVFVAFTSRATDIRPTQDRADLRVSDVFLRDRDAGTTTLISVTAGGASANGPSSAPSVDDDGQIVAFQSDAGDLVAGDTNGLRDIFVRDRGAGTTRLVSVGAGGVLANGPSDSPMVSGDGRHVVFRSEASNLVANDTNGVADVFVHHLGSGATTLVSVNQLRTASGNGPSFAPSINVDGDIVAFASAAADLVTGDNNNSADVFIHDLDKGTMNLISMDLGGAPAGGNSGEPFIDRDGDRVAFSSAANDLAVGDANGLLDVFVTDAPNRGGDAVAPTASVVQIDQPPAFAGATALDFTVTYADETELAPGTFGNGDVVVSGPNGFSQLATFVGSTGSGKAAKATYRVVAPGGSLDAADDGTYTAAVQLNEVEDAGGNVVAALPAGSFQVQVSTSDGPDLVASVADPVLPAVSGNPKGRARVVVTNTGSQPVAAAVEVGLFLSDDPILDDSDTLLATSVKRRFRAKAGKFKRFNMKFAYPALDPGGARYLLARADTTNAVAESRENNNIAARAVTVAPPFVDLTGSLGAVPTPVAAGQRVRVPLTVTNHGNTPAAGRVTYSLVASTDALADGGGTEVGSFVKRLKVSAGKSRTIRLPLTMPALPTGTYLLLAQVDSANALGESSEGNNTVISAATFSVS